MVTMASTKEYSQYTRSQKLVNVAANVLRDIFQNKHSSLGTPQNTIHRLKGKIGNLLSTSQREILYPECHPCTTDLSDLEIPTLYILLRYSDLIPAHETGWGNMPDKNDRSMSANIDRTIRSYNKIPLEPYFHIDDQEFNSISKQLKNSLLELSGEILDSTVRELLAIEESSPMDWGFTSQLGPLNRLEAFGGVQKTRYLRCSITIQEVFTKILQEMIKCQEKPMPPELLHTIVKRDSFFQKHLIDDERLSIPSLLSDGYSRLSFTLLYKLLRYFNIVDIPTQGWGSTPEPDATSLGDDAERLRKIRIKITHRQCESMSSIEMKLFFDEVTAIAKRVDSVLGNERNTGFETSVTKLQNCKLDDASITNYTAKIEQISELKEQAVKVVNKHQVKIYYGEDIAKNIEQEQSSKDKASHVMLYLNSSNINPDGIVTLLNANKDMINNDSEIIKIVDVEKGSIIFYLAVAFLNVNSREQFANAVFSFVERIIRYTSSSLWKDEQMIMFLSMADCVLQKGHNEDLAIASDFNDLDERKNDTWLKLKLQIHENAFKSRERLHNTILSFLSDVLQKKDNVIDVKRSAKDLALDVVLRLDSVEQQNTTLIKKVCDSCEFRDIKKEAAVWCMDCEEAICIQCYNHHKVNRLFRKHTMASIKEYMQNKLDNTLFCNDHYAHYEIFCCTHEIPLCLDCLRQHNQCSVIPLGDATKHFKLTRYENLQIRVKELRKRIESACSDVTNNLRVVNDRKKMMKEQLREMVHSLGDRIEDVVDLCIADISDHDLITKQRLRELSVANTELEAVEFLLPSIGSQPSDSETFMLTQELESSLRKNEIKLEHILDSRELSIINPECILDMDMLKNAIWKLRGKPIKFPGPSVLSKAQTVFSCITPITLCKIKNIEIKPHKDRCEINGCSILEDNKCCFSDENNKCLMLISSNGTQGNFSSPQSPMNVIFAGDAKVSVFLKENKSIGIIDTNTWVCSEIRFGNITAFGGLAYNSEKLIVAVESVGYIIINFDGKILKKIRVNHVPSFNVAWKNDRIYCTFSQDHRVVCSDMKGNNLWEFKNLTVLKHPKDIAVDETGNVFVAGTNNVIVISFDGKQHKELISSPWNLKKPLYIAYHDGKLLVCTSSGLASLYSVTLAK